MADAMSTTQTEYTQADQTQDLEEDDFDAPLPDARRKKDKKRRKKRDNDDGSSQECACRYCGICDRDMVAQCTDCRRWFCNGRGATSGAHIVHHFVRSHHKGGLVLHAGSKLGDTQIECYSCRNRNPFLLGSVPAKEEQMMILLCRNPCASRNALKDVDWEPNEWSPLISDRRIVHWLLAQPSEKKEKRARPTTLREMQRLEELWMEGNTDATIDDLNRPGFEADAEPVRYYYTDAYEYEQIFKPLVAMEVRSLFAPSILNSISASCTPERS